MSALRKIDRMHALFGLQDGHTCGECSNFVRGKYRGMMIQKCKVYGMTHSTASDWAKRYPACGMFNHNYTGVDVIRLSKQFKKQDDEHPLDGQLVLE